MHDFKPWCTNRQLFALGAPCERCHGGAHWHAFATGCVQGSRMKSAIAAIEAYAHDAIDAYRNVRLWIAPSRFVADKAASLGADARHVRVLPHGLEPPPTLGDGAAGGAHAAPGEPYVLAFGRLSQEKGVHLLPAVARAIAPTPLAVAGAGPLEAALRRERPANLALLGRMDDGQLAPLRAHAAAVLVPSLFPETFGYSVAEALLDGRAVVASRIGALPELIEHEASGLLVPPGDADALIAATRRALSDAAAPRWGAAARARTLALTEPRRHVEGLLAIYREALAS